MDKPVSLSVKDYIIRKMAVKMMVGEKVIEAVVNHQFNSANEALTTTQQPNYSVEIGGLGKWLFNRKKAEKKMAKYESIEKGLLKRLASGELSEKKLIATTKKLNSVREDGAKLNAKLKPNESVTHLRGMEEQFASPQEIEGGDCQNIEGENGNM